MAVSIEVHNTQNSTVTRELFCRDITDISVCGLVKFVIGRSVKSEKSDYGFDFPELCLNIFNGDLESVANPVECLGVGLPDGRAPDATLRTSVDDQNDIS